MKSFIRQKFYLPPVFKMQKTTVKKTLVAPVKKMPVIVCSNPDAEPSDFKKWFEERLKKLEDNYIQDKDTIEKLEYFLNEMRLKEEILSRSVPSLRNRISPSMSTKEFAQWVCSVLDVLHKKSTIL